METDNEPRWVRRPVSAPRESAALAPETDGEARERDCGKRHGTLERRRFRALLLGSFALLAMILFVIGVCGILNNWNGARQKEISIRVALGAQRPDILRWVGSSARRMVVIGVGIGNLGCLGSGAIVLESERLLFRKHEPADLDAYCAMESDLDVRRYVGARPRPRDEAERRFHEGALQPVSDKLALWATVLKPEGNYIGRCGLYPHFSPDGSIVSGEATLAFYLAREYWGQGFATEAGRAFIRFGFEDLHLSRIVATVQVGNQASVRVLEKLGFELVAAETGERSFFKFALRS